MGVVFGLCTCNTQLSVSLLLKGKNKSEIGSNSNKQTETAEARKSKKELYYITWYITTAILPVVSFTSIFISFKKYCLFFSLVEDASV